MQSGHPDCIGRIGDLAFLIEQRQHALPGRNPLVDVGERIGKRTQRPGDLRKDRQVGDERARLQIAPQHQAAAVDHQHRRRGNPEKLARRRRQLLPPRHAQRDPREKTVDIVKLIADIVGRIVPFEDFDPGQRFVHQADHIGKTFLRSRSRLAQPLDDRTDHQRHDRQENHRKNRQLPRNHHQRDQETDDHERIAERNQQRIGDAELHDLHIGRNFRNDVPLALVVEITDMQPHHVIVHPVAEPLQRTHAHGLHHALSEITEQVAQKRHQDDEYAEENQHVHFRIIGSEDTVYQKVDEAPEIIRIQRERRQRGHRLEQLVLNEQRVEQRHDQHEGERIEYRVKKRVEKIRDRVLFDGFRKAEQPPIGIHSLDFIRLLRTKVIHFPIYPLSILPESCLF